MHGFRAVASRFRDVPPKPRTHRCFAVTVSEVADVAAHLRRITVQAPELRDYRPTGPDEYFGLVIPPAGKDLVLPEPKGLNIRAELGAIPEESRPDLRWYTVRSHDPAAGRLLIDVVTHGDNGPGSAWALRTGPGDAVGLRTLTSAWRRTEAPQLLVADPSSAPALRAPVEARTRPWEARRPAPPGRRSWPPLWIWVCWHPRAGRRRSARRQKCRPVPSACGPGRGRRRRSPSTCPALSPTLESVGPVRPVRPVEPFRRRRRAAAAGGSRIVRRRRSGRWGPSQHRLSPNASRSARNSRDRWGESVAWGM